MSYNSTSAKQAISGAVASMLARFCAQPFDVLKVRFQLQAEPIKKSAGTGSKYHSLGHAFYTIYHEEGIRAFWRGHIPAQMQSIFYGATQFTVYEQLLLASSRFTFLKHHPNFTNFVCGGTSGLVAVFMVQPMDIARTRLIAQDKTKIYKTFADAFTGILRKEGVRGYYRGIRPALLEIVPYNGFSFMLYRFFAGIVMRFYQVKARHDLPMWTLVPIGAISSCISKAITYPLDIVRKRLHIQGFAEHRTTFGAHTKCGGIMWCLKRIIKNEGFFGLYKGLIPTFAKSAVTISIQFAFYDYFNKLIGATTS